MKGEGVPAAPGSGSNDDLEEAPFVDESKLRRRGERTSAVKEAETDEPPEDARTKEEPAEAKQCKICLGGVEEEGELGRLISPCKCKGTIAHVHIECLNEWRKASQNPHSYYQCDNCTFSLEPIYLCGKYKYNFRRTALSAYLRSRWVLHLLTLLSLAVIVLLSGYLWKVIGYFSTGEGRSWHSWLVPDYNHFLSGLFLVSFAGTLKLLAFVHGPLPRWDRGGDGNAVDTVILGIVLFIGLCRATWAIYKMVERLSRKALERADDLIVEVN